MTATTNHCGETCGLVDFTLAIAGDRLLPEERMDLAVQAVQLEKMTQRGAAMKYGVSQGGLSKRLKKAVIAGDHPPETQSTTQEPEAQPAQPAEPVKTPKKSDVLRDELRALCREHGATRSSKFTVGAARAYLTEQGVDIPAHLQPKTKTTQPSPSNDPDPIRPAPQQPAPAPAPPATGLRHTTSDECDEERGATVNGRSAEELRDDCVAAALASGRPADYKRTIELLAELDHLITAAWRRQHPEPWIAGDWSHVAGELHAIHSIANQRAVELSQIIVQRYTAVSVTAVAVP